MTSSTYDYLDIDSTFRQRDLYPNPADFVFTSGDIQLSDITEEIQVFPSITTPLFYNFRTDVLGDPYSPSLLPSYQYYNLPLMYETDVRLQYFLDYLPALELTQEGQDAQFPDSFNNAYPNYFIENVITGETRQIVSLDYISGIKTLHTATVESYQFTSQFLTPSAFPREGNFGYLTLYANIINDTRPSNIPNIYIGKFVYRPSTGARSRIIENFTNRSGNIVLILAEGFTDPIEPFEQIQIQTDQQWLVKTDRFFTHSISQYPAYINTPDMFNVYATSRISSCPSVAYSSLLNRTVVTGLKPSSTSTDQFGISYVEDFSASTNVECEDTSARGTGIVWLDEYDFFFAVSLTGVARQYISYDGNSFENFTTNINGVGYGRILLTDTLIILYCEPNFSGFSSQGIAVANRSDLTLWTQVVSPLIHAIVFNGTQFVGIQISGPSMLIHTSPNAITWTFVSSVAGISGGFPSIAYSPISNNYIIVDGSTNFTSSSVYRSSDLITWTPIPLIATRVCCVFFSNVWQMYVIVLNQGYNRYLRSTDGVVWTTFENNSSSLFVSYFYTSDIPQGHFLFDVLGTSSILFSNMVPQSNSRFIPYDITSYMNQTSNISFTLSDDLFITSNPSSFYTTASPIYQYLGNLTFTNNTVTMLNITGDVDNFPHANFLFTSTYGLTYISGGVLTFASNRTPSAVIDNYQTSYSVNIPNFDKNTIFVGSRGTNPTVMYTYLSECRIAGADPSWTVWTDYGSGIVGVMGCLLYSEYTIVQVSNLLHILQFNGASYLSIASYTMAVTPNFAQNKPCALYGAGKIPFIAYQYENQIYVIRLLTINLSSTWNEYRITEINDVSATNKRIAGLVINQVTYLLYSNGTQVRIVYSVDDISWAGPLTIFEASNIYDIQTADSRDTIVIAHGNVYTQLNLRRTTSSLLATPYRIRKELPALRSIDAGPLGGVSTLTVTGNDEFSSIDGAYNRWYLWIASSDAKASPFSTKINSYRQVIDYDGTTKTLTFNESIEPPTSPYSWELWKTNSPTIQLDSPVGMTPSNQWVCFQIELLSLILPNQQLLSGYGNRIAFYPYIYVSLQQTNHPYYTMLYSMNPSAQTVLFKVPINNVNTPTISPFVVLTPANCLQHGKFMLNSSFRFQVLLPNGDIFLSSTEDTLPPEVPDPFLQVSATFRFKRIA